MHMKSEKPYLLKGIMDMVAERRRNKCKEKNSGRTFADVHFNFLKHCIKDGERKFDS